MTVPFAVLADTLLLVHAAFVLFVIAGGLLVLRWPGVAWVHLPAAVWGALIEFAGLVCPLTPLEQAWRGAAGEHAYEGGFIEHYVTRGALSGRTDTGGPNRTRGRSARGERLGVLDGLAAPAQPPMSKRAMPRDRPPLPLLAARVTLTGSPQTLDRGSLLSAVRTLTRRDPGLAWLVARHGPPPLWARRPGFASLLRIILEQQVSLASARAIYHRLAAAVGEVQPAGIAALGPAGLQALGLTRQKASYIGGVAEQVLEGRLLLRRLDRYGDDDARAHLMRVRGIGPWTADIYLLMALRRPDIWPPGDLALHKALGRLVGSASVPSSAEAERLATRWRPLRAVAARILWHAYLAERAA